jgi:uncharacterized protein YacL
MPVARIRFTPDSASYFCYGKSQQVVEMKFESVEELIRTVREMERDILDCTAIIDGKVIDLRAVSERNAST